MENYFNYFTEIEEFFWKQRGTTLLLSTLDWALIDAWKEARIPLETVLKGIARSFEKHDAKRRKIRMVNSLAYCQQEVLAAFAERQKANPEHSAPEPFARQDVIRHLRDSAGKLEEYAASLEQRQRPESAATFKSLASSLGEMAAEAEGGQTIDYEAMERRLTVLEEKIFSTLMTVTDEKEILAIRGELDRQLAAVRGKMNGEQIGHLQRQFIHRKLLEKSSLPRLSLFYL